MPNETNTTDPEDKALLDAVEQSLRPVDTASGGVGDEGADEPVILVEPTRAARPEADAGPKDPAAVAAKPAVAAERRSRGGLGSFLGLVIGGALCTGAGFWLGESGLLRAPAMDRLAAELATQQSEIAQLKTGLASRPAPAPDPALTARITALEEAGQAPASPPDPEFATRLSALETRISGLQSGGGSTDPAVAAEISALKAQVESLQSGGGQAVEAALAGVRQQINAAAAEAEGIAAKAEAATRQTLALAAVGQIGAALDSGLPYTAALANLGAPAPAILADAAQSGLPTLNQLRDRFPEAARTGLEAALRADLGAGWTERVGNFLRAQTGARSLAPREGNDPDAILSRAEAAIGAGDVAAALNLVKTLPQAAQSAMADWIGLAEQRLAAQAAIADLASKVGGQ